jgi:predicted AAA+ superfamily ATPase
MLTTQDVIDREFNNLEVIKDNFEKYVISLDDISIGNKQGIKHLCAWELETI